MSVNPGGLAVPLGTNRAVGKQYKAQEARLVSPGTGSSPFICFKAKTSKKSKQGPPRPPVRFKAYKGHSIATKEKLAPLFPLGQLQRPLVGHRDSDA